MLCHTFFLANLIENEPEKRRRKAEVADILTLTEYSSLLDATDKENVKPNISTVSV